MFILLSTLLAATALAVPRYDYLFVTNGAGGGAEGKRFVFDDFGGGGTYPCLTSETLMDFSPNGESRGISRNYEITPTRDWLWVSITGAGGYDGCTLSSGLYCIGAARIDLSLGTFTRTWNQNYGGGPRWCPK